MTAFDRLEREFFHGWVRRDPLRAVDVGLATPFDGRVPDGTIEHVEQDILVLKRAQAKLQRVATSTLTPQRQIDAELLGQMIHHRLSDLDGVRRWESIPEAPRRIGEALYQLLGKNYAPLKVRLRRIMTRLDLLPRYLDQTKTLLRRPVKILIENELETITRLPSFFHNLREIGRLNLPLTPMLTLARQLHVLQNAVEQYYNWLIIDVLSHSPIDFTIPRAEYGALMKSCGVPLSPETMLSQVTAELDRLKHRLREIARRMKRRIPIEDLRDRLKGNHPQDFDGVLKFVREQVNRTREFVDRTGFATLPPREGLYVVEMPTFLRHVQPLARTGGSARLDGKVEGYFMVSPGDCDSDRLKEFSHASMTGMALREGYPGRHLLQTCADAHPSLSRRLYHAPETVQGWMLYGEERVREMGYDETPQGQFLYTLDLISRVVRAMIDLELHAGKMTVPEAVNLLIDEVGMDRIVAEAQVRGILIAPAESLSALYGRDAIKELRRETRDRLKAQFNEKAFHDAILGSGALPIPLLKRHLELTLKFVKVPPKPKVAPPPKPKSKPQPKPKQKARPKPKARPRPERKSKRRRR